MTTKRAIELLQQLPPDEHIILAWWEREMFPEVSAEDWPAAAANAEDEMDWQSTHMMLSDWIAGFLDAKQNQAPESICDDGSIAV